MKLSSNFMFFYETFGLEKTVDIFSEAGFEGIDFNTDRPEFWGGEYSPQFYKNLAMYAEHKGIRFYQTHAPFDIKVEDELANPERVPRIIKGIEISSYLGADMIVVHPSRQMERYQEIGNYDEMIEKNIKFYSSLLPYAEEYGVKIAVENINWCVAETGKGLLDILDGLDNDMFTICYDVGHAHLIGQDAGDMIRTLGNRIGCTHIHDNDRTDDVHTIPYLGTIDWEDVMKAFAEVGYDGNLNYEAGVFARRVPEEFKAECANYMAKVGKHLIGRYQYYKEII